MYLPNASGYEEFTKYIHQNEITGLIHGIGLPISTIGLFIILYALAVIFRKNTAYVRYFAWFILGGYLNGYITYQPVLGSITILYYGYIIFKTLSWLESNYWIHSNPVRYLGYGILLLGVPVLCMEFIGHWYLEGYGSDVSQLANSIFQTPLYGTISILHYFKK